MSKLTIFILVLMLLTSGCGQKYTGTLHVNESYRYKQTLCDAVIKGDLEQLKLLILGADNFDISIISDAELLYLAARKGHKDIAEFLIANWADVNAKEAANDKTPLHIAAQYGYKDIAELLIAKGAVVDAKDLFGSTPLYDAIEGHYTSCVEKLLENKYADINTEDEKRRAELEEELIGKLKMDMLELLINSGADVNLRVDDDITPLYVAMDFSPTCVFKLLLDEGANHNLKDEYGRSMLAEAVSEGWTDIVELLLEHDVRVNTKDIHGQTPLHEAVWGRHKEIAKLLIAKGIDVDSTDKNGDTPLHVAALKGDKEFFDLLIAEGADINAKNKEGKTPLDYARAPAQQSMVILSDDTKGPYSVIIGKLSNIRTFLYYRWIDFDRIWIPKKADIQGLDLVLKSFLEQNKETKTDMYFDREFILENLPRYNKEYSGFIKKKTKYVICNMILILDESLRTLPNNEFTTGIYDGGCSVVQVVFNLETKKVDRIDCQY